MVLVRRRVTKWWFYFLLIENEREEHRNHRNRQIYSKNPPTNTKTKRNETKRKRLSFWKKEKRTRIATENSWQEPNGWAAISRWYSLRALLLMMWKLSKTKMNIDFFHNSELPTGNRDSLWNPTLPEQENNHPEVSTHTNELTSEHFYKYKTKIKSNYQRIFSFLFQITWISYFHPFTASSHKIFVNELTIQSR